MPTCTCTFTSLATILGHLPAEFAEVAARYGTAHHARIKTLIDATEHVGSLGDEVAVHRTHARVLHGVVVELVDGKLALHAGCGGVRVLAVLRDFLTGTIYKCKT